jgi:hypothetical protein
MQVIIDYLSDLVLWLYAVVVAFFVTLFSMLADFVCWIFQEFLALVLYIADSIDLSFLPTGGFADAFNAMPEEVINIFFFLQVPYLLSLIISALFVRFLLQLIPFTRLGS